MHWLILVLLLAGCESAKIRPWVSYSEHTGSNLGINEAGNRFVNSDLGESWTAGIAFEFPLGPSAPAHVIVDDWPRGALWTHETTIAERRMVEAASAQETPEKALEERAIDTAKAAEELTLTGILKFALIVAVVLVASAIGVGIYRKLKRNGSQPVGDAEQKDH